MLARGRVRSGILPLPGVSQVFAPLAGVRQRFASAHGWHGPAAGTPRRVSHRQIKPRNAAGRLSVAWQRTLVNRRGLNESMAGGG